MDTRKSLFLIPAVALALVVGCGSGHSGQASADKSKAAAAVASSAAIQADITKGKTVVAGCLEHSKTITGLKGCLETAVPVSKRAPLKSCLIKAGLADHLSTKVGRQAFETAGAPACVGAALPAATTSPSPVVSSPKASKA